MRMPCSILLVLLLALLPAGADDKSGTGKPAAKPPENKAATEPVPGYKRKMIEGFNVLVNNEVLEQNAEKYKRPPMRVLELELKTIVRIMRPEAVKVLRNLVIWVEWDEHIDLKNGGNGQAVAVYYGGSQLAMLRQGMHPWKANNITVLSMKSLTAEHQPDRDADPDSEKLNRCVILHEMAHAVHHYYVGFENSTVKLTYQQAMERHLYDEAKTDDGRTLQRPYASVSANEYFAELSSAYLDRLYYYPFSREDLKKHDPAGYRLMEEVWGKTNEQLAAEKAAKATKSSKPMANTQVPAEKPKTATISPMTDPDKAAETAAANKLKKAKEFLDDGKKADAREWCEEIIKKYGKTKAAEDAKQMLEELKK